MNWRRFLHREAAHAEQREELESYLNLTAQGYIERGMHPNAAREAARKKLGNPTLIREEVYQMNTLMFVEGAARQSGCTVAREVAAAPQPDPRGSRQSKQQSPRSQWHPNGLRTRSPIIRLFRVSATIPWLALQID